jgi:hypothetical protein
MALLGSAFLAPGSLAVAPVAAPAPGLGLGQPSASPAAAVGASLATTAGALALSVAAAASLASAAQRRQRRGCAQSGRNQRQARAAGPLSLPWAPEPGYRQLNDPLLAEMDAGFDPLELGTKQGVDSYYSYREAEQKHGRLAMLATVGWVTSEELQGALARQLGLKDDLAAGELAPSLLNGGLGNLPSWFLPSIFVISGLIEVSNQKGDNVLKYDRNRTPGDLNFDPLSLQSKLAADGYSLIRLHNAEVKHGRAAMIAITAFAFQEYFFKIPVVIEDEIASDRVVKVIDKAIDNIDKAGGLRIPDFPLPFPGL